MTFLEIATQMAVRNEPQIRTHAHSKKASDNDWTELATTDLNVLARWSQETPNANAASVAKAEIGGFWFWEIDSNKVLERLKNDTGKTLDEVFRVRSSPGKGHYHFRQNAQSIAMGNIAQGFVKCADWSARVHNQYVMSPGSIHPITGLPYEIVSDVPITEAPDWLIHWLVSQKIENKPSTILEDDAPVLEGGRNTRLTSIAGKLRQAGLDKETLEIALINFNQKNCIPPLEESEVLQICGSISKYPVGKDDSVLVSGRLAGTSTVMERSPVEVLEPEESVVIPVVNYPSFPTWCYQGTSLYMGLVDPICSANSRIPEFVWYPAMVLLLNYIGTKVRLKENPNMIPSIFLALIGKRGETHKSSSIQDAVKYFEYAGVLGHGDASVKNAEGRALLFSPASPEGLGKEMQRTNCKNGVLYFDELGTLCSKAGIESSALASVMLTLYESGKVQNIVKSSKDSYSLLPGDYCASLLVCSTDKSFLPNWAKLAGKSTGLNDRFTFLLPPKVLPKKQMFQFVPTQPGAIKTRQLIDKAIKQAVYDIPDKSILQDFIDRNDNSSRTESRLEKYALGFAIDLGRSEIDSDCLERAVAILEYELAVKKYLKVFEASTKEGSIQMEILHYLQRNGGNMILRDLFRYLHPERHGSSLWNQSYQGLIRNGWIREEGKGVKVDPKRVVLLRVPEDDDD